MAKRFTDTNKWKKTFIRELPSKYKLLWFYILDDCDVAGLWEVDLEIAEIRIGEKLDKKEAIEYLKDNINIIDNGKKWFITNFIEFQYGTQLTKTNNIYKSIEKVLIKYDLFKYLTVEISETGTTESSYRGRISKNLRDKIFYESDMICQYCSEQKPRVELVVDHFIPLNKGGDNSDENLICSCKRCNSYKSDIMPNEFLNRSHKFLNPTEKILTLNEAFKSLKAPFSSLLATKDKDKDKEEDKVKDMELVKEEDIKTKRKNIFSDCFTDWFLSENQIPFKMQTKDFVAIASIEKYCNENKKEGFEPIEMFRYVLSKFNTLPDFYQNNKNPSFINSKFPEIIALIRQKAIKPEQQKGKQERNNDVFANILNEINNPEYGTQNGYKGSIEQ